MKSLCDRLGITEAIKTTNLRGIQRTLARELSQLPKHDESPKLGKMIEELKALSRENSYSPSGPPSTNKYTGGGHQSTDELSPTKNIKQQSISIKEIGIRIYKKWGKDLELKSPPKYGYYIPYKLKHQYDKDNKPITKFPD